MKLVSGVDSSFRDKDSKGGPIEMAWSRAGPVTLCSAAKEWDGSDSEPLDSLPLSKQAPRKFFLELACLGDPPKNYFTNINLSKIRVPHYW